MKCIIFDMWGTLVDNGTYSPIRQAKNMLRVRAHFSEYVVKLEKVMMLRKFESLHDAFNTVCSEFNLNCDRATIERLVGLWNKNWLTAKIYEETADALAELKKDYKLVLVSNTDNFSSQVIDRFDLRKYFDMVLLSCEAGKLKEEMFGDIAKKFKLKKEDMVMVGDSYESDIKPAVNFGIKAVMIDRSGERDYENKIGNLTELKKFL